MAPLDVLEQSCRDHGGLIIQLTQLCGKRISQEELPHQLRPTRRAVGIQHDERCSDFSAFERVQSNSRTRQIAECPTKMQYDGLDERDAVRQLQRTGLLEHVDVEPGAGVKSLQGAGSYRTTIRP